MNRSLNLTSLFPFGRDEPPGNNEGYLNDCLVCLEFVCSKENYKPDSNASPFTYETIDFFHFVHMRCLRPLLEKLSAPRHATDSRFRYPHAQYIASVLSELSEVEKTLNVLRDALAKGEAKDHNDILDAARMELQPFVAVLRHTFGLFKPGILCVLVCVCLLVCLLNLLVCLLN
jgi:hypothetical protein